MQKIWQKKFKFLPNPKRIKHKQDKIIGGIKEQAQQFMTKRINVGNTANINFHLKSIMMFSLADFLPDLNKKVVNFKKLKSCQNH